jgi:hypothetical protein
MYTMRDMFPRPCSMAIVGNSPAILDHEHGTLIDGHDVVVRFNRAQVKGYESRIGARTDIHVANSEHDLSCFPPPRETLQPRCVVWYAPLFSNKDPRPYFEWVGDIPLLMTMKPDLIGIESPHSRKLTLGTYTLYAFLRLFDVKSLFLTGFTMYGAVPGGTMKYYSHLEKGKFSDQSVAVGHDLIPEARIIAEIVSQYARELTVTPEVGMLLQRYGCTRSFRQVPGESAIPGHGPVQGDRWKPLRNLADRTSWYLIRLGMGIRRLGNPNLTSR